MSRLLLFTPFLATALAAQVPAAPVAPVPPRPPRAAMAPMAPMNLDDNYNFDFSNRFDSQLDDAYGQLNRAYSQLNSDNMTATLDRLNEVRSNFSFDRLGTFGGGGPVAWAQQDPADSLYRDARDQLNRGDYRKAATLFKSLPQKFPSSVYIADAQYWQAFALYRIGDTADLQEALTVLDGRKPAGPANRRDSINASIDNRHNAQLAPRAETVGARDRGVGSVNGTSSSSGNTYAVSIGGFGRMSGQTDAAGLAARIANVLSSRGLADNAMVKRALASGGNSCDDEEQSVRAEALSALMQSDPETGRQMAAKILGNKDDCSAPLRRNAVVVLGSKGDASSTATLVGVAKSDPSQSVRIAAMQYLVHRQTPEATDAVLQLMRSSDDAQIQRAAVSALAESTDPKVRAELRALAENNSANESLRIAALDTYDRDRTTADDATWLRALYGKTTDARIKERIINIVSRNGGDANSQWLVALVRNDDEPLESRTAALSRAGRSMDVATLVKMYDASPERPIRQTVLELLADHPEPAALDKVVDVAKNGTDPAMRRMAIGVLARSKDPRASKLLLQLVDKS